MADWRLAFEEKAAAFIDGFVAQNPKYAQDAEPFIQGATNFVTRGSYQGEAVVFKYYSNPERWRNELFCLRHFSSPEIVPKVYDWIAERLTVMAYIPGSMPRTAGIDGAVLEGYEEITGDRSCGEDWLALLFMNRLERLIRVTDAGKWTGSEAAKEDARRQAEGALTDLDESVMLYRQRIDIERWFPSLIK